MSKTLRGYRVASQILWLWQNDKEVQQEQHAEEEQQEYFNQDWQTYLKNVHRHCNSDNPIDDEPTQVTIQSEMQDAETKDIHHIINEKLTEPQQQALRALLQRYRKVSSSHNIAIILPSSNYNAVIRREPKGFTLTEGTKI